MRKGSAPRIPALFLCLALGLPGLAHAGPELGRRTLRGEQPLNSPRVSAGLEEGFGLPEQRGLSQKTEALLQKFSPAPGGVFEPDQSSTRLMLEAMERVSSLFRGADVLDTGAGTGVLGIAAVTLFGAKHVLATEPAMHPLDTVRGNVYKFHVRSQVDVRQSWLFDQVPVGKFDVALFNAPSEQLAEGYIGGVKRVLRPDGVGLLMWHWRGGPVLAGAARGAGLFVVPILADPADGWRIYALAARQSRLDPLRERTQGVFAAGLEEGAAGRDPQRFVDAALGEPFIHPPQPPAGLVPPGAVYGPTGVPMTEEMAANVRTMAEDLITRSTPEEPARRHAREAVETLLSRLDGEAVPGRRMREMSDNEVMEMMLELVRVATGVADPYAQTGIDPRFKTKRQMNEEALLHLDGMERAVRQSEDPLRAAINMGIIGNAIDFADAAQRRKLQDEGFDVARAIRGAADLPYRLDARDECAAALRAAPHGKVLFLVDNAGEIIFDLPLLRLLLEQGREVVVGGKSLPHANDMTAEDLQELFADPRVRDDLGAARLDAGQLHVIATGTCMTGCDLRRATPELVKAWREAAVVYAKGQGMVETLRYAPLSRDIFHAVKVKATRYFHEKDAAGNEIPLSAGDNLFLRTSAAPPSASTAGLEEPKSFGSVRDFLNAYRPALEARGLLKRVELLAERERDLPLKAWILPRRPDSSRPEVAQKVRAFVLAGDQADQPVWEVSLQARLNREGEALKQTFFEVQEYPADGKLGKEAPSVVIRQVGAHLPVQPAPASPVVVVETLDDVERLSPAWIFALAVNEVFRGKEMGPILYVLTLKDEFVIFA